MTRFSLSQAASQPRPDRRQYALPFSIGMVEHKTGQEPVFKPKEKSVECYTFLSS